MSFENPCALIIFMLKKFEQNFIKPIYIDVVVHIVLLVGKLCMC